MRFPVAFRVRPSASLAVPVGMVISTLLVYQTSDAAFSAKADNGLDSWSAGSVRLELQGTAATTMALPGMLPATSYVQCVNVQYKGDVAAVVHLYGSNYTAGGLGQYLNVKVEEGQLAPKATCVDFATTATVFPANGEGSTLSDFMANRKDFATGAGTWAPSGLAGKVYRFTFTVADVNASQNTSTSATFTWEARSGN